MQRGTWSLSIPPAVLSRRPQRSHLKCFAFWCEIKSFRSSKSRSPAAKQSVSTWCGIQADLMTAPLGLKRTVVTPGSREHLLDVGMSTLLAHLGDRAQGVPCSRRDCGTMWSGMRGESTSYNLHANRLKGCGRAGNGLAKVV